VPSGTIKGVQLGLRVTETPTPQNADSRVATVALPDMAACKGKGVVKKRTQKTEVPGVM
jgi:hypothetical protein